ncbi:MAG: RHS repeat protein [Acidobacteria bacterium]|nr:RHS repeat protein [Acidobacteriota bacterium]
MGRAYRSSNPFRADLGETAQWTTTQFDDLGRVTEVTTPDNAKVTRRYYGSSVRVFDQADRSRAGVSDALGRLVKVVEYDNGTDLETLFTYDVVGRLRKTIQGSQTRFFLYDDLGRLIRAKQTEQQVNTSLNITDPVTGNNGWAVRFDYDNNGNIVSTTDSRGVTTAGTYDNLNRMTFRDYSDSTPDVAFTYDDQNIANSKSNQPRCLLPFPKHASRRSTISAASRARTRSSTGQPIRFPTIPMICPARSSRRHIRRAGSCGPKPTTSEGFRK